MDKLYEDTSCYPRLRTHEFRFLYISRYKEKILKQRHLLSRTFLELYKLYIFFNYNN